MKPLILEETILKEEIKNDCFWDNIHYKNPEAEKVFNLICHLEDLEVQYWELQQENKKLKEKIDNIKKIIIDNSYDELYEWFNELREERVIEIVNILDIKKDIEQKRGGINE